MSRLNSQNGPGSSAEPDHATSWAARFGRVILDHGVATIPSALFHYQGRLQLKAQEVWFICYILARKWRAALPYPSFKQIEAQTGVTERQLQYVRSGLEQLGYLHIHPQYSANGGRSPNCYDFTPLFAALEAVLAADALPDNPILGEDPPPLRAPADTSFAARYGRVIARAGIATVPLALFTYQRALRLTPEQVWFTTYILTHKWTGDLPYPSIKRMTVRTGYSERRLHSLKNSLIALGYLRLQHRYDDISRAQESNAYDFSALLERITALVQQQDTPAPLTLVSPVGNERPVGGQRRSRAARIAAVQDQQSIVSAAVRGALAPEDAADRPIPPPARPVEQAPMEDRPARARRQVRQAVSAPPGSGTPRTAPAPGPHSDYLERVLTDLSRELGDAGHTRANVTQAHRLWHRLWAVNGLADAPFIAEYVQAARRRTRKAQGAQGPGQIQNKMAYFFRVLRELVDQQVADPARRASGTVVYG